MTKLFITKGSFSSGSFCDQEGKHLRQNDQKASSQEEKLCCPTSPGGPRAALSLHLLFLDKSPRPGLRVSALAAAERHSTRREGSAVGHTRHEVRTKRAPAAARGEREASLRFLCFIFSFIKAKFPAGNPQSFLTCPSYCYPGMLLQVLISPL